MPLTLKNIEEHANGILEGMRKLDERVGGSWVSGFGRVQRHNEAQ
jgi:hypothetical protein